MSARLGLAITVAGFGFAGVMSVLQGVTIPFLSAAVLAVVSVVFMVAGAGILIPWRSVAAVRVRSPFVLVERNASRLPLTSQEQPRQNRAIIESDGQFEFYPDRNHLPDSRRTRAQLEAAKDEVYASWNTGQLVLRGEMLRIHNRKRILLPHPIKITPYLSALERNVTSDTIAGHIEQLTRQAWQTARDENLSIEVRWLTKTPRNTVMLCDPHREHGWAHVELLQPGVPEDLRPTIWFTKARFPILYDHLLNAFNTQWAEESVDPLWQPTWDVVGAQISFDLAVRWPIKINGVFASVTTPIGETFESNRDTLERTLTDNGEKIWFAFPQHFAGASPAHRISGLYKIVWHVREGNRWRQAIETLEDICIA